VASWESSWTLESSESTELFDFDTKRFYPGRMRDAGQGMNSSRSCLVSQTFQTSSMFQTQLSGRQLKTFSAPWFWIVLDDVSIVYSFAG